MLLGHMINRMRHFRPPPHMGHKYFLLYPMVANIFSTPLIVTPRFNLKVTCPRVCIQACVMISMYLIECSTPCNTEVS